MRKKLKLEQVGGGSQRCATWQQSKQVQMQPANNSKLPPNMHSHAQKQQKRKTTAEVVTKCPDNVGIRGQVQLRNRCKQAPQFMPVIHAHPCNSSFP